MAWFRRKKVRPTFEEARKSIEAVERQLVQAKEERKKNGQYKNSS